jgi:hypothetical protein
VPIGCCGIETALLWRPVGDGPRGEPPRSCEAPRADCGPPADIGKRACQASNAAASPHCRLHAAARSSLATREPGCSRLIAGRDTHRALHARSPSRFETFREISPARLPQRRAGANLRSGAAQPTDRRRSRVSIAKLGMPRTAKKYDLRAIESRRRGTKPWACSNGCRSAFWRQPAPNFPAGEKGAKAVPARSLKAPSHVGGVANANRRKLAISSTSQGVVASGKLAAPLRARAMVASANGARQVSQGCSASSHCARQGSAARTGPAASLDGGRPSSRRNAVVRHAPYRDAVLLFPIETHKAFCSVLFPVKEPCEDQQVRTLDASILPAHAERLAAHANGAGEPVAAGAQVGR